MTMREGVRNIVKTLVVTLVMMWIGVSLNAAVTATPEGDGKVMTAEAIGLDYGGVDALLFTDSTHLSLRYDADSAGSIAWYRYLNSTSDMTLISSVTNASTLTVSDLAPDTGYIVTFTDKSGIEKERKSVWVVNGLAHKFTPIWVDTADVVDECQSLNLISRVKYDGKMTYQTPAGMTREVPRRYGVRVHSLSWDGTQYNDTVVSDSATATSVTTDTIEHATWVVDAPYCHTVITLGGDQIREAFGVVDTIQSDTVYVAKALTCHLIGEITEREGKNEIDRKLGSDESTTTQFGGSAPLNVYFTSNANTPVAQFFSWTIIDQEYPEDSSNVYHDENLRYSFTRTGVYKVLLEVSRQWMMGDSVDCRAKDSLVVTVSPSLLQIPSAFSPNGDGVNDEFRVAFKSLSEFHCTIYNRWGHKLFEWSDPSRGWDGKSGGRLMPTGPYYYVIKAKGTDEDSHGDTIEYSERGVVNLFR